MVIIHAIVHVCLVQQCGNVIVGYYNARSSPYCHFQSKFPVSNPIHCANYGTTNSTNLPNMVSNNCVAALP